MNNIEAKTDDFDSATTTEARLSITNSYQQVLHAQRNYLQSVIHTATLFEKKRRRQDRLKSLFIWGLLTTVGLIALLIDSIVGLIYWGLVFVIALVTCLITRKSRRYNYCNRKYFFEKYEHSISPTNKLKWKKVSGPLSEEEEE